VNPERPGSLETLRRHNRVRVLEVLRRRGAASRAAIGRETGLSRTSVSSLVADLIAEGVVVESPDSEPRSSSPNGGRPSTPLTLDPSAGGVIGMDFGHDSVRVILTDLSYTVLDETLHQLDVDNEARKALAHAAGAARTLLDEHQIDRDRVVGAGVALSTPVRNGVPTSRAIFRSWLDIDVSGELEGSLGVPVQVGNDANLGALAEAMLGAGQDTGNLVYVMLSAGVGAGLVLDGRLYEGETGTAGELGHVVVNPDGLVCRCGNRGCLETVAGASALAAALHQSHGDVTLENVLRLADEGDSGAQRVIIDAGHAVGQALAGICSVLDPKLVVVGGELADAGDLILESIRESIERAMTPSAGHSVDVVAGELGSRAQALGAAVLAASSVPIA